MDDHPADELTRGLLMRLALLAPPGLSGAAAVLLLASSPATWGAARDVGLSPWAPTASAVVVGLPALAIAAWGIIGVRRRMSGLFEVDVTSVLIGGAAHWVASVSLVIFAGSMTSAESYRSLGAEGASSAGFLFLAGIASLIANFLLLGLTVVYVSSVTPGRRTRAHEKTGDEVDFVEEWTRRPTRIRPR